MDTLKILLPVCIGESASYHRARAKVIKAAVHCCLYTLKNLTRNLRRPTNLSETVAAPAFYLVIRITGAEFTIIHISTVYGRRDASVISTWRKCFRSFCRVCFCIRFRPSVF